MTDRTTSYPVDAEHGALRLGIVIVFIIILIITYSLLNLIIPSDGINLIAVIGAFIMTALLTQQFEKIMRQRWPSGRILKVNDEAIQLTKDDRIQDNIDTAKQVNVLLWRFEVKRRSRIPKGWFMIACALEQDDQYLPVYTFMSPDDCEDIKASTHFTLLTSRKNSDDESRTDLRLAGEQRRLHTAESARWLSGAEMSQEDFKRYIRQLQEQFPQWMPSVL